LGNCLCRVSCGSKSPAEVGTPSLRRSADPHWLPMNLELGYHMDGRTDGVQDIGDVGRELRTLKEQRFPHLMRAQKLSAIQCLCGLCKSIRGNIHLDLT